MKTRIALAALLLAGLPWTAVSAAQAAPAPPPQAAGQRPVQQVASPRAASSTSAATASDYRLGAGDKLRIEVYREPQLSQSLQIRPDGKITMPLIGDLPAVELTPIELRDQIANALREYVTNPVVTVIVVEALASNIYVMGEVIKPGPIPLQGPMTALQAIAMAGGFKDFANTRDIRILRRHRTGVETIKFNYREAIRGNGTPIYLRAGDTVIVP